MRAVMLMFDTLTRKYLSSYGNEWTITPNFKRLEENCIVFDQFYGGSMPCMPARRELHTGKYNFLHRGWGPLEPFDFSVIEALSKAGIYTHLVTDHSHYFEDGGATYHNRYCTWEGFRGQEGDRWVPRACGEEPPYVSPLEKKGISRTQHWANRTRMKKEEDMPGVKTIEAGLQFLEQYKDRDDWFLQIECFDPHEPFYVPETYRKLYEDMPEQCFNWPGYQPVDMDEYQEDIAVLRKEYAALITMCDRQLGRVLDLFDQNDMWKDTLLIVNTDHGFLLGEHHWLGKNFPPMYDEIIHIPFFIHLPGGPVRGRRRAVAQTIDIAPTLLDFFKQPLISNMEGRSLLPLVQQDQKLHETILFGTNGGHINLFDGRYLYMRASASKENTPLINCTLMPTLMRGFFPAEWINQATLEAGSSYSNQVPYLKVPVKTYLNSFLFGTMLFDMEQDPDQKVPCTDAAIEAEMIEKLKAAMWEIDAPIEEFLRVGLIERR